MATPMSTSSRATTPPRSRLVRLRRALRRLLLAEHQPFMTL